MNKGAFLNDSLCVFRNLFLEVEIILSIYIFINEKKNGFNDV